MPEKKKMKGKNKKQISHLLKNLILYQLSGNKLRSEQVKLFLNKKVCFLNVIFDKVILKEGKNKHMDT